MTGWEYLVVEIRTDWAGLRPELNAYGGEGWEAIQIGPAYKAYDGKTFGTVFPVIFKRPMSIVTAVQEA